MENWMNLYEVLGRRPDEGSLWEGAYKIPWNDAGFSRRMLAEHLSQEHDLASRRQETILDQVRWIDESICGGRCGSLLDLGCGPGLYVERFAELGYDCCGIDFSPASVEYARQRLGDRARLVQGDVRTVDFGGAYDLVMMLYGEVNVFSPADCRRILTKACQSLAAGGSLLLEAQRYETVRGVGEAGNSWYKSGAGLSGLFSDEPYICLTENYWLEAQQTAVQQFHIIRGEGDVATYRNTTRAWRENDLRLLLAEAGFGRAVVREGWPVKSGDTMLIEAHKD